MRRYFFFLGLIAWSPCLTGQVDILTANYDVSRTNTNSNETVLTTSNVNSAQFGRVFALAVDGQVYTQPLYVQQLQISGGTHNVVFVATMRNTVFAFDADAWSGQPLWVAHLGPPVPRQNYGFSDVSNDVGILGTPVIDSAAKTLYAVSDNLENGIYSYRLHALDIATGTERQGSPVAITGSVKGTGAASENGIVPFVPFQHLQRPGLLLSNGKVYIAFGSHSDNYPYHGWLMAYDAASLQQTAIFCTTPDGGTSAIWQSGRAPAADAEGNIYVGTGNGDFDGVSSFGESFLKLSPDLQLKDWFTPDSWLQLNSGDYDLGSSGMALIPGTDLLIGGGKSGTMFMMHSGQLGHTQAGNGQVAQSLVASSQGMFGMAVWNGPAGTVLYVQNSYHVVDGYRLSGTPPSLQFETLPSLQSAATTGTPYEAIAVSSNGTRAGTGIVWATSADDFGTRPGQLLALDAADLSKTLWTSRLTATDDLGLFAKFAVPTIANGKVYVPTFSNQVLVYGLTKAADRVPQITTVTNAANYSSGPVSPGEIVTLFGAGLGPATLESAAPKDGFFGDEIGATRVLFDGAPAPLIYSSSTAVTAIVPFGLSGSSVSIQVQYQGRQSTAFVANVAAAAPGLFSSNATGIGQGAFLNQDLSLNSAANPVTRGSALVLYGTGQGAIDPAPLDGGIVSSESNAPPVTSQPISVTIGGVPATVTYSGATPGQVAGLIQINVVVPEGVTPGSAVPIVITAANAASQAGITASIK